MKPSILTLCLLQLPMVVMAAAEAPPTYWPQAPRPELALVSINEISDGVPITVHELSGAGLRIRLDAVGGWVRRNEVSPEFSALLGHPSSGEVRLGFAVFDRKEFLRDLEPERWASYLSGLRTRHGENLTGVAEGGNFDGNPGMFVFGKPYRDVAFQLTTGPGGRPLARREVFVVIDGRMLVIVLEGPPAVFPTLVVPLQRFLARLELKS